MPGPAAALALVALFSIAFAAGGAFAEGGIAVAGSVRAVAEGQSVGALEDVALFEGLDGHPYMVLVGDSDTVMVVSVADPGLPTLAGAVSDRWFADAFDKNVHIAEWPEGGTHAVISSLSGTRILNVSVPHEPAVIHGIWDGARFSAAPEWAGVAALFGAPDGRVYALASDRESGLAVFDMTDPRQPALAGGLGVLGGLHAEPHRSGGAVFADSSPGRLYAAIVIDAAGVYIVDVTDADRPALASSVRFAGNHSAGERSAGGPAARVDIPPAYAGGLPEHNEVLIGGAGGAGLLGASNVAVAELADGRAYMAVANDRIFRAEAGSGDIPAGVMLFDVTEPTRPVPAGVIRDGEGGLDVGPLIRDMVFLGPPYGDSLHLAVSGSGSVWLLDVTEPSRPVPAGVVRDGEGGFESVGGAGIAPFGPSGAGRTYLASAGGDGIRIVDVTEPSRPLPAGAIPNIPESFYTTGGAEYTETADLGGRTYALGTGGDGFHMLDVTDPSAPAPAGSAWDGRGGFDALDGARHIAVAESPDGQPTAIVAGSEGIQMIDITDPRNLVPAGTIPYEQSGRDSRWVTDIEAFRSLGGRDYLLVADHGAGVLLVDLTHHSGPILGGGASGAGDAAPILGGSHLGGCPPNGSTPNEGVHGVEAYAAADGRDYVLVACDRSMHLIDVSVPSFPRQVGSLQGGMNNYTFGAIYWATVYEPPGGGAYALLADYRSGTHIVDVTDPRNLAPAGSISEHLFELVPGVPVRVVASGEKVLALTGWNGQMHVRDITDPRYMIPVDYSPARTAEVAPDLASLYITAFEPAAGGAYALADGGGGVVVLNLTGLDAPEPGDSSWPARGSVAPDRIGALVAVGAGDAVISVGPETTLGFVPDPRLAGVDAVHILDMTDPYAPLIVGAAPAASAHPGKVEAVVSPDGRIYGITSGPGGLLLADIARNDAALAPAEPRSIGPAQYAAVDVFSPHDGRLYVMAGVNDSVWITDVTYPSNPIQVSHILNNFGGFYHMDGIRDVSVFESGGLVYALVGSDSGIQIIDVTNPYGPSPAGGMRSLGGALADGAHRTATVSASDGRVLALAVGQAGDAEILDISDPQNPAPAGVIPAGQAGGPAAELPLFEQNLVPAGADLGYVPDVAAFEAADGRLYAIATGSGGLHVTEITDPASPGPKITVSGIAASDILSVFESADGRLHALLAGYGAIWAVDVDDPSWLYDHVWP